MPCLRSWHRHRRSALQAIQRQEAFESQEFWYHPPATARYSNVEMNAYASESK